MMVLKCVVAPLLPELMLPPMLMVPGPAL